MGNQSAFKRGCRCRAAGSAAYTVRCALCVRCGAFQPPAHTKRYLCLLKSTPAPLAHICRSAKRPYARGVGVGACSRSGDRRGGDRGEQREAIIALGFSALALALAPFLALCV
eukprot:scaffold7542_cov124-Isochrysis_galbana.AAC.8